MGSVITGVAVWDLEVMGSHSLKEKRSVVKGLKERMQARYRASVAETDHHDLWQRAQIAAAVVGSEHGHVAEVLDAMNRLVQNEMRVRVISAQRDFH